jgi:hypothetical protein
MYKTTILPLVYWCESVPLVLKKYMHRLKVVEGKALRSGEVTGN